MLIGSGVTEAAGKTLVKQRLCQSGMKWLEKGAGIEFTGFGTNQRTMETILGQNQSVWFTSSGLILHQIEVTLA